VDHLICRVKALEPIGDYSLRVSFGDGTAQDIDFAPVLRGELYGPLRDLSLFNQVSLDTEAGTLVWPNGADFDPATLHDWPACAPAFIAMASRWEPVTV
jgi:hypothetical protein